MEKKPISPLKKIIGLIFVLPFIVYGIQFIIAFLSAEGSFKISPALIFAVGLLFIVGISRFSKVRRLKVKKEQLKREKNKTPDQILKSRKDWAKGYSAVNETKNSLFLLAFGSFFLMVTGPVWFRVWQKGIVEKNPIVLAALVFPAVGGIILYSALKHYRMLKAVSPSHLFFSGHGVIGGKFLGQIKLSRFVPQNVPITIRLNNKRIQISGSSESSRRNMEILWQNEISLIPKFNGRETILDLDLEIPFDTVPTFAENANLKHGTYAWDLSIEMDSPHSKFKFTYDIPVFKTDKSDSTKLKVLENRELGAFSPKIESTAFVAKELSGQGLELKFTKEKAGGVGVAFGIFGLVFSGVGFFGVFKLLSSTDFLRFALPIPFVFILVGLFLAGVGIVLDFQRVRMVLDNSHLVIHSSLFGFQTLKQIPYEEITEVILKNGMQKDDEVWYDLKISRGPQKPSISVMTAIRGKKDALWVLQQIEQRKQKHAS